ncbi:MAG: hypothetical protein RBS51_02580 [Anaerovoracaceae bacterium]|nr:hypothetical protein [Anaerovoracaceae bacterium]
MKKVALITRNKILAQSLAVARRLLEGDAPTSISGGSMSLVLLIVAAFSIGCEKELKSNSMICNLNDYSL